MFLFFSFPTFWRRFIATTVPLSSEACPRWNKTYTSIGLYGNGYYLTGFGRLTSEHYFSQESARQSLMWYGGMRRAALYLSLHVSFFSFFLTPLLFKESSEHLNDQNSAAWLSAPTLSNLDGYVSASERGRHEGYTYTNTNCTHTHAWTQRFASESSVACPDRRTPLSIPGSWAGQKSGKMCSSVEMQSIIQLSRTTSYLFS